MDANTPILTGPTLSQDPADFPPPSPMLVTFLQEAFKWQAPSPAERLAGMDGAVSTAMRVSQQAGRDEVIQFLFNLANKEQ